MTHRQFLIRNGQVVELAPENFVALPDHNVDVIIEENRWAAFTETELYDLETALRRIVREDLHDEVLTELARRRLPSSDEAR